MFLDSGVLHSEAVVHPYEATDKQLQYVHTGAYMESLKSPESIAKITRVPGAAACPFKLLDEHLLRPMR